MVGLGGAGRYRRRIPTTTLSGPRRRLLPRTPPDFAGFQNFSQNWLALCADGFRHRFQVVITTGAGETAILRSRDSLVRESATVFSLQTPPDQGLSGPLDPLCNSPELFKNLAKAHAMRALTNSGVVEESVGFPISKRWSGHAGRVEPRLPPHP